MITNASGSSETSTPAPTEQATHDRINTALGLSSGAAVGTTLGAVLAAALPIVANTAFPVIGGVLGAVVGQLAVSGIEAYRHRKLETAEEQPIDTD